MVVVERGVWWRNDGLDGAKVAGSDRVEGATCRCKDASDGVHCSPSYTISDASGAGRRECGWARGAREDDTR